MLRIFIRRVGVKLRRGGGKQTYPDMSHVGNVGCFLLIFTD